MAFGYETISTEISNGVLTATISNPPINVMTLTLYLDLVAFTSEVEANDDVKVLVMQSADPDFFIAHFDLEILLKSPIDKPAEKQVELSDFHSMCERVRTMPKPTIAKIAGRVGGGGNEFSSSCDMRFGLRNKTLINQMEVPLGILPGGCGTQQLPRLIGRSRAMEVILGGDDLDAETAEAWGYLNKVFDTQADLDEYVDRLAHRIALWPRHAVALAKQSVLNYELPIDEGLKEEAYLFQQTLRDPSAMINMQKALDLGAQTREGEMRIGELSLEVARATFKDS
ncbi:MAG: enoyl-CoA hydratase/isomerase family protein [Pseudomonadales bacterium]|nr:enoyl-CoA hydratase/isomerase family protein [Pseudomonadales bacterium]